MARRRFMGLMATRRFELALACLAEATGEERYAAMGRWFLNVRGQDPDFYDEQNRADGWDRDFFAVIRDFPRTYYQAAEPIADQRDADGHAVRVTYLCTGLAHIARLTGDASLAESAERLWDSIVRRRMYITGQNGSTHVGESFTYDYDLPNDTMYGETCASVGMSFFARQMLAMKARGEYGDVLEKELFNGTLAGMSLDGTHFYYVNPLEADPRPARAPRTRAMCSRTAPAGLPAPAARRTWRVESLRSTVTSTRLWPTARSWRTSSSPRRPCSRVA